MRKGDLVWVSWAGVCQLGLYLGDSSDGFISMYSTQNGVVSAPKGAATLEVSATAESEGFADMVVAAKDSQFADRWIYFAGPGSWLTPVSGVAIGDITLVSRHNGGMLSLCMAIVVDVKEDAIIVAPAVENGGPYGVRRVGELYCCFSGTEQGSAFVSRMAAAVEASGGYTRGA